MDYVNLGQCGLKVSRICLGMMTYGTSQWRSWILDEADARPIVQRAVELGVNFFDTADMLCPSVQHVGLAVCQGAAPSPIKRLGAVRIDAEPLQPDLSGRKA
jgi:predicted aldo/keto reductase-like oxidoreductase